MRHDGETDSCGGLAAGGVKCSKKGSRVSAGTLELELPARTVGLALWSFEGSFVRDLHIALGKKCSHAPIL